MQMDQTRYRIKIADCAEEIAAAQRLRYRVFVEEMGARASAEEIAERREWDAFDPWFDHLILTDASPGLDPMDRVVGVYRLMRDEVARRGPGFYGASEFDLGPILRSGRRSLELGRSCIAPAHRGGPAMHLLWNGLAAYVLEHRIEILFGVASFPGTEIADYAEALELLAARHLAPEDLRVRAWASNPVSAPGAIDPARGMKLVPPLIRAYLKLGGWVGEGVYVDRAFNTLDVCVVMDTTRMTERYREFYQRQASVLV